MKKYIFLPVYACKCTVQSLASPYAQQNEQIPIRGLLRVARYV